MPDADGEADVPDSMDEAAAALGLEVQATADTDLQKDPLCYLWPCNVATFNVWQRIQTQWREGMNGRTGLDYAGVLGFMKTGLGMKPRALQEMFSVLQSMESAVLAQWNSEH
jgi:hypothetical protein